MTVEMLLNLAFGLAHKPEVIAYPCATGQQPKSKGCRIPKWIEDAGPAVELFEAIIAPHQMIDLFGGCLIEQVTRRLIATKSGLTTIQRLSTDLTDMVHAHQPGRLLCLLGPQCVLGIPWRASRWIGTSGLSGPAMDIYRAPYLGQKAIQYAVVTAEIGRLHCCLGLCGLCA